MFERLPATRWGSWDSREAVLTLLSVGCHTLGIVALLAATWLSLAPLPLPEFHPRLLGPVVFPRAGAPAPRKGGGEAESHPPTVPAPVVAKPLSQPTPTPTPSDPASPVLPSNGDSSAPAGPGRPDGLDGGSELGVTGGGCIGVDCDLTGPIGPGRGGDGAGPDSDVLIPGVGGVTEPAILEATKVLPHYPDLARRSRVPGRVILQAVVTPRGTVDSVQVLSETPPRLGFGPAAVEAVSQWRYRPALQEGQPVAVYLTITVEFELAS